MAVPGAVAPEVVAPAVVREAVPAMFHAAAIDPVVHAPVSVLTAGAAAAKARGNPPAATAKRLAAARAAIGKAHARAPGINVKPAALTTGERAKTRAAATLIPVSRDAPTARINVRAAAMIG